MKTMKPYQTPKQRRIRRFNGAIIIGTIIGIPTIGTLFIVALESIYNLY